MALKKLEYFIKPSSVTTIAQAQTTIVNALNSTQEAVTNKLSETTYKDDYFAGLFDARDKKTYIVFSDVAKTKNGMPESLMDITPSAGSVDLTGYATHAYVDEAIASIPSGTDTYVIG
ncbi:MAG: hypothetical protein EOL93_00670 [Epsilonproteobacteria bacterium]|nr:hypothetical protein [Campylobacterota bacterium]